jgi:hypothetical protein
MLHEVGGLFDLGRGVSSHGRVTARLLVSLLLVPVLWSTFTLAARASEWSFMDYVNLPFHEAGHLFFSPFGETIHILGGTLGELLVPLLLGGYFLLRQRQPMGAAFCLWWLGENFIYIARYMGDARDLELPLVGGGDHDWNELFYRFGLLSEPSVASISSLTHFLGVGVMLLGIAWLAFFALPAGRQESLRAGIASRWPRGAALIG